MRALFSLLLGLLTLATTALGQAQGASWTCDGSYFQVRAPSGQPSTLFSLVNPPDNSAFVSSTLYSLSGANVTPSTNTFVNGLAYRRQDNYLYALHRGPTGGTDTPNNNLYRMGQSGAVALGVVTGLPASFAPTAADFDDAGVFHVLRAGTTNVMYRIDVTTTPPSVINSVTLSITVNNVGDMSYRPNPSIPGGGTFTGLISGNVAVNITPSGQANTFTIAGLPGAAGWGTTWADASGFLYGYDNLATGGTAIYRINLSTNSAIADSTGPTVSGSDGASCINTAPTASITGTVFIDANASGVFDAGESGVALPGTVLTVYAINGFNQVAGRATIDPATGRYAITGLLQSSNYQLVLANNDSVAIGAPSPAASLPVGFVNTGESLNGSADGTVNGAFPGITTPPSGGVGSVNFGVRGADMVPVFSGFPASSTAGATVTGVLTCTNSAGGAAALSATCTATATTPSGLLVTIGSCTPTVPVASLAAGASISCNVSVNVPTSGSFTVTGLTGANNDVNGGTTSGGNNSTLLTRTVTLVADLGITKNNGVNELVAGSTTVYDIVVTNNGPSPADGTTVQDPVTAGLNCTALSCPAASLVGGAVCPSGAGFTLANLQGSGVVLPTLPGGSAVTLRLTCEVTASGL
jgi:uncharacterized repeat protein (TIGR01451 family)